MDVAFGVVLVAGLVGAVFGLSWLVDALWSRWDAWQARRRRRCQVRQVSAWRDAIEDEACEAALRRARREADRRDQRQRLGYKREGV